MGRRDGVEDYEVGKDRGWSKKIGTGVKKGKGQCFVRHRGMDMYFVSMVLW